MARKKPHKKKPAKKSTGRKPTPRRPKTKKSRPKNTDVALLGGEGGGTEPPEELA